MRGTLIVGLSAVLGLLIAPAATAAGTSGTSGPFVGLVSEGQSKAHAFDNNPLNQPCLQVVTWYTVRLSYDPPSDALGLSAAGYSTTVTNGQGTLTFQRNACTSFTIQVTGLDVESQALYVLQVSSGSSAVA